MRHLTEAFAIGALRPGRSIEQFLGATGTLDSPGIRWVEIVPTSLGFEVVLHASGDVGGEQFCDLVEFPPLADCSDEDFGRKIAMMPEAHEAIRAAQTGTGASPDRWVNQGFAGDEYLDYVRAAAHTRPVDPWAEASTLLGRAPFTRHGQRPQPAYPHHLFTRSLHAPMSIVGIRRLTKLSVVAARIGGMPLCDYFSAVDDEAAVGVLQTLGGPGQASFDVVSLKNIDPVVCIAQLEAILAGCTYDEASRRPRSGQLLSSPEGEGPFVVSVSETLCGLLAAATAEQVAHAAEPWAMTQELQMLGVDTETTSEILAALAGLARRAQEAGMRLYCWWAL